MVCLQPLEMLRTGAEIIAASEVGALLEPGTGEWDLVLSKAAAGVAAAVICQIARHVLLEGRPGRS